MAYRKNKIHIRKENCFLQIAYKRSNEGWFFVNTEGYEMKHYSLGFAILKGPTIAQSVASSLSQSVLNKRQQLIDKNIVDQNFTFTQDWSFSSLSLVAAIVVGYSINGQTKSKRGSLLKEIETKI